MQHKMLNVGCGSYFDQRWTNIDFYSASPDVIRHDIRKGLPFPAASFGVVYHSHILEHLDRAAGLALMRECNRVLKPHGILRVVVPDLEFSCRFYLESLERVLSETTAVAREHYDWSVLNLLDQMVRTRSGGETAAFLARQEILDLDFMVDGGGGTVLKEIRNSRTQTNAQESLIRRALKHGALRRFIQKFFLRLAGKSAEHAAFRRTGEVHQWMYDQHSLRRLFNSVGLEAVQFLTPGTSSIPEWTLYGLDIRADGSVHKPHSLFAEAVKLP